MKALRQLPLATLIAFVGCSARLEAIGSATPDGSVTDGGRGMARLGPCPSDDGGTGGLAGLAPGACPDAGTTNPDGSTPTPDASTEQCGADMLCLNVKVDTSASNYGPAEEAKLRFAVVWVPGPYSKPGATAEVVTPPVGGWKRDANGLVKIRASDVGKPQDEGLLACPRSKTSPYQCIDNAKIGYGVVFAFEDTNADDRFEYCPPPNACLWAEQEYGIANAALFLSSSGTHPQTPWPAPPNTNVTMPDWNRYFPQGVVIGAHAYGLMKVNDGTPNDPDRPIPNSGAKNTFDWTVQGCVLHSTGGTVCSSVGPVLK